MLFKNRCEFCGIIVRSNSMPNGFTYKVTKNGRPYCKFNLVVEEEVTVNGQKTTKPTYFTFTAWGQTADKVAPLLGLNRAVKVIAKYRTAVYNGKKSPDFTAFAVFDNSEAMGNYNPTPQSQPQYQPQPQSQYQPRPQYQPQTNNGYGNGQQNFGNNMGNYNSGNVNYTNNSPAVNNLSGAHGVGQSIPNQSPQSPQSPTPAAPPTYQEQKPQDQPQPEAPEFENYDDDDIPF